MLTDSEKRRFEMIYKNSKNARLMADCSGELTDKIEEFFRVKEKELNLDGKTLLKILQVTMTNCLANYYANTLVETKVSNPQREDEFIGWIYQDASDLANAICNHSLTLATRYFNAKQKN